ncbi:hypothetical protein OAH15_01075, partial [bacterium]|nr:hypothetical protein [bacterium]
MIQSGRLFLYVPLACFLFGGFSVWGDKPTTPLELRPAEIKLNPSSESGMPVEEGLPGYPKGSNGQSPTLNKQVAQGLTRDKPAKGNFAGSTIFSGGWRTKQIKAKYKTDNDFYEIFAGPIGPKNQDYFSPPQKVPIQTPATEAIFDASSGRYKRSLKMKWAMIGAPIVSRPVSFLLGSRITPPKIDEFGEPIGDPESYWQAMPHPIYEALSASVGSGGIGYKINDLVEVVGDEVINAKFKVTEIESNGQVKRVELVSGGQYIDSIAGSQSVKSGSGSGLFLKVKYGFPDIYWSSHANSVFATQPGVIRITWKRNIPVSKKKVGVEYQTTSDDSHFALLEQTYVVSGSPVKPVKTIYWTEKPATGPTVKIPNAQINAVNIVYNSNFPERVVNAYSPIGATSIVADSSQILQDTRTLWFEYGALHANNAEGRAFVEYLGAIKANQKDRVHLGFEIVEIVREAPVQDITVDLGEAIHPYPRKDLNNTLKLFPEPVSKDISLRHLQDFTTLDGVRRFYANRKTENLNDVLVYWMEAGTQGIRWPNVYSRYKLQWPVEASEYSHYARIAVGTEAEAMDTAVSLPPENNPTLVYQSREIQTPAVITADQKFYTWLRSDIKEHRALIRFIGEGKIWYERVYSFLDTSLKDPTSAANAGISGSLWFSNSEISSADKPGYFSDFATVGSRIKSPDKRIWGTINDVEYWAGHIHIGAGTSYNPNAYIDPMVHGFEEANQGAIIPVNSIPGENKLEIWWFRKSDREGFKPIYWPSVVGTYTIQWPHQVNKYVAKNTENTIVLASNDGSGQLNSLQAKASIYTKNVEGIGYNPNEEHAMMIAGQAYALRDDLNNPKVGSVKKYSSDPYVLLEFVGSDGRPDMRAFQVLREQPELGIIFDYEVEAGTILQAPMPLPLLDKPMVERSPGKPPISLNTSVENSIAKTSKIQGISVIYDAFGTAGSKTTITTENRNHFKSYSLVSLQDIPQQVSKADP